MQSLEDEPAAGRETGGDLPERRAALLERRHVTERVVGRDDEVEALLERQTARVAGDESESSTGGPAAGAPQHRNRWLEPDGEVSQGRDRRRHAPEARADLEHGSRAKAPAKSFPEVEIPPADDLELVERQDALVVGPDLVEILARRGVSPHAPGELQNACPSR